MIDFLKWIFIVIKNQNKKTMNRKLIVFGNRVKPNRYYQVIKVVNGGCSTREEEVISDIMKGSDLFKRYGLDWNKEGYKVQRRNQPKNTPWCKIFADNLIFWSGFFIFLSNLANNQRIHYSDFIV